MRGPDPPVEVPRSCADDVGSLPGIQQRRRDAFARLDVHTLGDLLRLAPRRYEDRRHPNDAASLKTGETGLVVGRVVSSKAVRTRTGLSILEALIEDGSGSALARWFYRGFRPRPLEAGRRVAVYGTVKAVRQGRPEFASPELERLGTEEGGMDPGVGRLVPVHPCTAGLSAPVVRRAVWNALPAAAGVPDPLPVALREAFDLPPLGAVLQSLHFPATPEAAEAARQRLAFDELLVHELMLARRRASRQGLGARPCRFTPRVHERIRARLPFALTSGQERAVEEIVSDLERPTPMYRLLQGDVGSGKTAVAVYALLGAVASGLQVAFMAPTEVLARQHARTLEAMLAGSDVAIDLLVGGGPAREREAARARLRAGETQVVVGTHAVIGADVRFRRLGLVIVDEQHKFGVRQRRELVAKGRIDTPGGDVSPHCLVMTATPIPRTLALTVWGDMEVSVIEGRIPGRVPVETCVVRAREGRRVLGRVRAELERGRQAYVIYPLVEESDRVGLRDALAGRERWARALPGRRIGLLHGRMKREEKAAAMAAFHAGTIDLLVATVVVEVGVDVPNATVLVVEHAERFGLSQLHQLRGRIGRGTEGGLCVLVDRAKDGSPARLEVLAASADGFYIAEEDLRLRGVGDLFGTRQHGRPAFLAARLPRDLPLLLRARDAARGLIARDPALTAPENRSLASAVLTRALALEGDPDTAPLAPPSRK